MPTESVFERIEKSFHRLSKKQQKVAGFVLNNPTFVGTHTAAEVGEHAGTSETTVIRFCYEIGLEGYAQLQKEITLYVFNQKTTSTLGNYFSARRDLFADQKLIEKALKRDATKINRIVEQLDRNTFQTITRALHNAKNVYIYGAGASRFAADWLNFTMNIMRPNVTLIPTETPGLIRTLQKIDSESVGVFISLHRYYNETIQLAEAFHQRGIPVIAITDSKLAPILKHCSHPVVLEQTEKSTIDLMPALISFLNALVTGMMAVDPDYYNKQRVNYDDFSHSFIGEKWS